MDKQTELIDAAIRVRHNAYSPYSGLSVGAAVLTDKGIFTGCNVENASYGLAMCAERVAVFNAVAAGAKQIQAVAIAGGTDAPLPPCGACRQVLAEFNPNMTCILIGKNGEVNEISLAQLLPLPFLSEHLG